MSRKTAQDMRNIVTYSNNKYIEESVKGLELYVESVIKDVDHLEFTSFGRNYMTNEYENMCNERLNDLTYGVVLYYLMDILEGNVDIVSKNVIACAISIACTPEDFPDNTCIEVIFKEKI
jgi:hypothetical protein